jgi:hypothetical protein
VDRQHPRAQSGRRSHRAADLVRDVVELQVEEDAVALLDEAADQPGAFRREQRAADLEAADGAGEGGGVTGGVGRGRHIEGDQYPGTMIHHVKRGRGIAPRCVAPPNIPDRLRRRALRSGRRAAGPMQ